MKTQVCVDAQKIISNKIIVINVSNAKCFANNKYNKNKPFLILKEQAQYK